MKKRLKKWLIVGSLIVVGVVALTLWFLPGSFSAKQQPSELEIKLARLARHFATPVEWREAKNPIAFSPEVLGDARHHFADHCATCHANDGSGKTEMGPKFNPPVPDLRSDYVQSLSDGELFYVIHFGIRLTGMPAWGKGDPEKDLESWKLVHFIRHLPQITPEEIAEMKTFNPMTREERAEQEAMDRFLAGEDVEPPAEHHH